MNKTIQAYIALAAFAAIFVVPSVASASPELTSPTGTKAPVGTLITVTNAEHAVTPKRARLTTPSGTIECESVTMTGEVSSNTGTDIGINLTTVQIANTASSPCDGGKLGKFNFTPNHTSNVTHNGVSSLPWCLTANGLEDKALIRGGNCSEALRPMTFLFHTPMAGTCSYEMVSISADYTTHPTAAILTIPNQKFFKSTGSIFCPAEGALEMALTLETDTGTPGDVYIK